MKLLSELPIYLLASRNDIAGMNILNFLATELQKKVIVVNNDSIHSDEEIKNRISSKSMIIFLSRHSARSLRPSFTVHPIGNFGTASFGGRDATLIECSSFLLKKLLLSIKEFLQSKNYKLNYNYEYSLEVTHHGPFSNNPILFIEVGSSEAQWKDLEACRMIAEVVNHVWLKNFEQPKEWISAIGFGGNHYANKFTKLVLKTENAIGHICAKYALSSLNTELINQMIMKTIPKPRIAFFDKKSMKRKQEIKQMLSAFDIEVIQI
ncbi:MAG: D-aminoacyl-tRNA deacylase [Candidatus Hodarchaeota archaeon]